MKKMTCVPCMNICRAHLHMDFVYKSKSWSSALLSLSVMCVWTYCIGSQKTCIHSVWSHQQNMYRPASLHSLGLNDAEIILQRHNKKRTKRHGHSLRDQRETLIADVANLCANGKNPSKYCIRYSMFTIYFYDSSEAVFIINGFCLR